MPERNRVQRPPARSAQDAIVPLPHGVREVLSHAPIGERHPGLHLDKLMAPCDKQEQQYQRLQEVIGIRGDAAVLDAVRERRDQLLEARLQAPWTRQTQTPLTLHLSRSGMLENAGICLHPLYGFLYLPGSGLKGLARAFAETVWLSQQPAAQRAEKWRQIEAVFGWGPKSDEIGPGVVKPWKPEGAPSRRDAAAAHSGEVVFHDALPLRWPSLMIDIVNNHHTPYYQGRDYPGDWDDPIPVYFLAASPGQAFSFALSPRRMDAEDNASLLWLARQWLDGGLTHLGCGAKTAAGYGRFAPPEEADAEAGPASFRAELTLLTPAFLAGAAPYGAAADADCDLRAPTLRGLLRWWWRTLHAGYLNREELASLEASIWGDTLASSAVRIVAQPLTRRGPYRFDYKDRYDPKADFKRRHQLADRPNQKTTQGLFYLAYGMDERSRGEVRRRHYLDAGSAWEVRLTVRETLWFANRADAADPQRRASAQHISRDAVLRQAQAALWLLCQYGGVGAKSRKGFGSLRLEAEGLADFDLDACRQAADSLRRQLGLGSEFRVALAESSCLDHPDLITMEARLPWRDAWQAIDHIGFIYQAFAQRFRHDQDRLQLLTPTWSASTSQGYTKASLGLPRRIHGPLNEPMRNQSWTHWQAPEPLGSSKQKGDEPGRDQASGSQESRHAAPVHLHLAPGPDDSLVLRIVAFPAKYLPNLASSAAFLKALVTHIADELTAALTQSGPVSRSSSPAAQPASPAMDKRPFGAPVMVKLVAQRTKKRKGEAIPSGYVVQEVGRSQGVLTLGAIPEPPPELGETVEVFIHDDQAKQPQYRWDAGAKAQGQAKKAGRR